MLQYIKLPKFKRSRHTVEPKSFRRSKSHTTREIPFEIQEIICNMILKDDNDIHQYALTGIRVCKSWANLICSKLYSECQFRNYIQFIGFVNTVTDTSTLLPYHLYVKKLDLTLVNKYGIDHKTRRLLTHCPNIHDIIFSHTSVKPKTLQFMGKYCDQISNLELGSIQSFPFMFHCDFSGMTKLTTLSLCLTPIQATSFKTIPPSVRHLHLAQMNAIQSDEFLEFLEHNPQLLDLAIHRCKLINTQFVHILQALPRLKTLELVGLEVTDDALEGCFDTPRTVKSFKLCHSQITDKTLKAIALGAVEIDCLDISRNEQLTAAGIEKLEYYNSRNRIFNRLVKE